MFVRLSPSRIFPVRLSLGGGGRSFEECSRIDAPNGRLQRDVVYLGWPIATSYMIPNAGVRGGELRGLSQWVQLCTGTQINFGDLHYSIFNLWLLHNILHGCSLYINSPDRFNLVELSLVRLFPLSLAIYFARLYNFFIAAALQAVCVRGLQGQSEQLSVWAGVCAAMRRRDCYRRTTAGHPARSSTRNR